MMTPDAANPYKQQRFPDEIISHAVWRYFRFPLSHRDVEEFLFARGIIVSSEAIRKWCRKSLHFSEFVVSRSPGQCNE
jgi:putative transposase